MSEAREKYIPDDMAALVDAELNRLRVRISRDPVRTAPGVADPSVERRLDAFLLGCILVEMRELRALLLGAFTEPAPAASALPAECDHPSQFRVDQSRMGQEPLTEFFCSFCQKHVSKEQQP